MITFYNFCKTKIDMTTLVSLENVSVSYGQRRVL
ncbi:zinc ABC transporter ATP-binding protein ZnuC, partial [Bacillus thuringiensis]|nr:zinc ABC transporter ATP-binding protein ZnuC [Bacillus thuringiensis]